MSQGGDRWCVSPGVVEKEDGGHARSTWNGLEGETALRNRVAHEGGCREDSGSCTCPALTRASPGGHGGLYTCLCPGGLRATPGSVLK